MNVDSHLEQLKQGRVYFDPLVGNLGDDLILAGQKEQFRRHGIRQVKTPAEADHILIRGGGAFYPAYPRMLKNIQTLLAQNPAIPATILPASYGLTESLDVFCGSRTGQVTFFARETTTRDKLLQSLKPNAPINIELDHDSAFQLRETTWLHNLRQSRTDRHILLVERTDKERLQPIAGSHSTVNNETGSVGAASIQGLNRWQRAFWRRLPNRWRLAWTHRWNLPAIETASRQTSFARHALDLVHAHHADRSDLPVRAFDISQPDLLDLPGFARIIADAAVVVTTRLHVGIFAHLLEKPVYLVDGVYHKIRGIYNYSLRESPFVKLVRISADDTFVLAEPNDYDTPTISRIYDNPTS